MLSSPALSEVPAVPSVARRWRETATQWVEWKRATRGQYEGRNGQEAIRFLSRLGERLQASGEPRSPRTFDESDVRRILPWFGAAPKTKRFYLGLLSTFLEHHGNSAVHRSGILPLIPAEATRRRWLTAEELERLMDRALGLERVIVALEGFQGLRRVEVLRCRLTDLELAGGRSYLWVRGKAHRGEPSRHLPMSGQVERELRWYLPLRQSWAATARDVPELLAWCDGDRLRPYSMGTVDRLVRQAGIRAGISPLSNHDLRRTFGRILRNRGADWREIAGLYGHASTAETEYYVGQERERLEAAIALLEGKH